MAGVPAPLRDALLELRARLEGEFSDRLEHLVLFGSWARGEATEESDVDVLVVLRTATFRERMRAIELGAEVGFGRDLIIEVMALSDAQWAELEARERLIAAEIRREGVEVHA